MTPDAAPLRRSTLIRYSIAGALALAVGMGFGRFLYTALMPAMLHEGLLDVAQAAKLASINYLGYLAGRFAFAGRAAKGHEAPLKNLALCLGASALLLMLMGLTRRYEAMLCLRLLSGGLGAGVMVFGARCVLGRTRHLAVSACVHGGVGLGIVLGSEIAMQA